MLAAAAREFIIFPASKPLIFPLGIIFSTNILCFKVKTSKMVNLKMKWLILEATLINYR